MGDIKITKNDCWCYNFYGDYGSFKDYYRISQENCSHCGILLDGIYSYIIRNIRNSGLLPNTYNPICCYCDTLLKLGLDDLPSKHTSIHYDREYDILRITALFKDGKNMCFNIHNASKVLGLN